MLLAPIMFNLFRVISFLLVISYYVSAFGEFVKISNNGPIVLGANITFTAELYSSNGKAPTGEYKYKWRDNLYPQHHGEFLSNATSKWTVQYTSSDYHKYVGTNWVDVTVYTKTILIDWPLCRDQMAFELTDELNGNLTLFQNNSTRNGLYVSNLTEVAHAIVLSPPDLEYVKRMNNSIKTYWFIDCYLTAVTDDFIFGHNYTDAGITHLVEALVVVKNHMSNSLSINASQPFVNTSQSQENMSIEVTTSSDLLLNTISDSRNGAKFSYHIFNNTTFNEVPFNCKTKEVMNKNGTIAYGVFRRRIKIKAPVLNVTAIGNQWLQHSDMLNLEVSCQGSPPFKYCYKILTGYYNATGNETCDFEDVSERCTFTVPHYFQNSTHYSVLVIIRNDINKVVRSIGIDVYEVTKLPQLSVIVVPVSASIVAVVIIIFGIAYYIQSRSRFMIEVADFDFSINANGMEYKTFRERLMEAFHNAFDKTEDFYEQDSTNTASTNKKYGSMP